MRSSWPGVFLFSIFGVLFSHRQIFNVVVDFYIRRFFCWIRLFVFVQVSEVFNPCFVLDFADTHKFFDLSSLVSHDMPYWYLKPVKVIL